MGTLFHVGQKFELFKRDVKTNGAAFEALTDIQGNGAGFALVLFMPRVTEEEIQIVNSERVNARVLKETSSFSLPIFRFGNSQLMFEVAFDPTLYGDNRAMQLALDCNLLYIFVVDPTDDNKIKAVRAGSFPNTLRRKLLSSWSNAVEQPNFKEKYQRWVHDLWMRNTTKQIWKISDYAGFIGD